MNPDVFPLKGDFSQVGLPEVLEYLKTTTKTGVLVLRNGEVTKTLHFKDGILLFATSSLPDERLGDMLMREGKITPAQLEEAGAHIRRGKRMGKALVELQAIGPKDLWSEVRHQVQEIAYSVFQWVEGSFQFLEGEERTGENITTSLQVTELVLEGLRRIRSSQLLERRFPSKDIVFERVLPAQRPQGLKFEEFEKHVFKLVDGLRSVEEVCELSEVGDFETLKTLYIFFSIGYLHVKRKKDRNAEFQKDLAEARALLKTYNDMFVYLYNYLLREVGPIAENILEKYLSRLKLSMPEVFARVSLKSNGSLSEERILENLQNNLPIQRPALVNALNEYLYSALLAIRRTLGEDHEGSVLATLKTNHRDFFASAEP